MKRSNSSRAIDALVALSLSLAAVLLYRKIFRLWWMYDDPFLINILRGVPLHATLYDPALYAKLGRPIFNPLLMLSWALDLRWFGVDPPALYIHQLVSFALLPALLYLLFRLWSPRLLAAAAAGVFTISGPTLEVVPQLMLRHYVEGAVFATMAVILFVLAIRRGSWPLALASAFFYFCGAAAKEVYGPLILILIVIPERTLRQRVRLAIPHVIAAAGFVIWRICTIGVSVAPFGFVDAPGKRPIVILTIPFRALRRFASSGTPAGWSLLALIVISLGIVVIRLRGARLVAAMALLAAVLPLVPVAGEMQARWAFAPWLLAVSATAFLPAALPRYGWFLVAAVVVAAGVAYRVEWPGAYRLFLRMSDEGRVFALLGPDDILRDPASPPATMPELGRLTGSQARAFYDDLLLCGPNYKVRRVFEYNAARREVLEATRAELQRSCATIRRMPLELKLHFEPDGAFYWTAGPYRDGTWAFILWEGLVAYDVPREGGFRTPGFDRFDLRLRYTSPAGWRTYSPKLAVDARKGPVVFHQ